MDINSTTNWAAPPSVSAAIQGAASATGTSFEYLLATARAESGLNPQATSTTSTARGLYQIIDQTWLSTLKQSGPSLGYGRYADAIVQTTPGHYEVPDPMMRREIMALRDDPAANAAIAGALTQNNAAQMAERLGRKASDGELYIAHFLGPAGAAKLTDLAGTLPSAAADIVFPSAAEANRPIFYDRQGHARTVAEVYGVLVGRYDGARGSGRAAVGGGAAGAAAASAAYPVAPIAAAVSAGAAAGVDAGADTTASVAPPADPQGPLFERMFNDRGNADSPVVRALWASRPYVAAALTGQPAPLGAVAPGSANPTPSASAGPAAAPGSPRELFQTQATNAAGLFGR